jgi:hypothetical protein
VLRVLTELNTTKNSFRSSNAPCSFGTKHNNKKLYQQSVFPWCSATVSFILLCPNFCMRKFLSFAEPEPHHFFLREPESKQSKNVGLSSILWRIWVGAGAALASRSRIYIEMLMLRVRNSIIHSFLRLFQSFPIYIFLCHCLEKQNSNLTNSLFVLCWHFTLGGSRTKSVDF